MDIFFKRKKVVESNRRKVGMRVGKEKRARSEDSQLMLLPQQITSPEKMPKREQRGRTGRRFRRRRLPAEPSSTVTGAAEEGSAAAQKQSQGYSLSPLTGLMLPWQAAGRNRVKTRWYQVGESSPLEERNLACILCIYTSVIFH